MGASEPAKMPRPHAEASAAVVECRSRSSSRHFLLAGRDWVALLRPSCFAACRSRNGGLQNYVWFFGTPVNLLVLQRTFIISAWVTVVCVICAYPYAYVMTVVGPKLRLMLVLCVLIPFWVSGVVRTLSWVILLQDSGVINSILRGDRASAASS